MIPANNHPEIDRLIHLKNHLGGMTMSKLISYQFNIDTACVELVFDDRSQISIDFTAVENEVADGLCLHQGSRKCQRRGKKRQIRQLGEPEAG